MKSARQFQQANRSMPTATIQRRWVCAATLLCLAPLASLAQTPPQRNAPVTVTNTAANPVPTVATGTTPVSGTVGISGTPPVTVTNTAANPVPTVATGTTSVSGTVGISGTPAVTLAPGAAVSTTNTAPLNIVRLISGLFGTGTPLTAAGATLDIAGGTSQYGYVVPVGKRLVLNTGSVLLNSANSPPTGFQPSVHLFIRTHNGNGTFDLAFDLPVQQQPDGSFIAPLLGPVYIDQNDSVFVQGYANQGWRALVFMQGYLVDCGDGCTQQ